MTIEAKQIQESGSFILFDAGAMAAPRVEFFDQEVWRDSSALVSSAQGRAAVCIFHYQDREYVLRHYQRGGWMAKLCADRYLWGGVEQTRAWREWHLMAEMYQQGLPVPRPVAARVQRHGLWYSADLITERLVNVETLADCLMKKALTELQWRAIGCVVRRFHDAGIYHADLNARNILLNDVGKVFLIDFDKGERRVSGAAWQQENLYRLQRSLNKFKVTVSEFYFDETSIGWLLDGYREDECS
jgi:3-deoxy-D-manno-octulosonic acid kinase